MPVDPIPPGSPAPADRVADFRAPVLGLMGGADPYIPQERVDTFEKALTKAGVTHELVVYPGAPHSFFDRSYEEHAKESADAWERILGFISANS
jgi:carboxymethylenebutenolidase